MSPAKTHAQIVKALDDIEAEMFGLYKRLERLRLDLQAQWNTLPSKAAGARRPETPQE